MVFGGVAIGAVDVTYVPHMDYCKVWPELRRLEAHSTYFTFVDFIASSWREPVQARLTRRKVIKDGTDIFPTTPHPCASQIIHNNA